MIIQGDNGTVLKINIEEKGVKVDLSGATVEVRLRVGSTTITKNATVTGLGTCEVILTSEDLVSAGSYQTQATVNYSNGSKFSSNIEKILVAEKL